MKILGIGNAIVDVLCKVDDEFLIQNSLTKSTMKLIDETEFKNLLSGLSIEDTISGGSVANSMVGLSQLGNKLGGKLLGKLPGATAKSKAANMLGKADLGDTANNLHKELNQYIGRQGKNMKQVTGEDFAEFLRFKKHKTAATIPSGVLNKQQLNDLLTTASKEALAGKGGVAKGDTTPGATKPPAAVTATSEGSDFL